MLSWFKRERLQVSPEIHGVITEHGQPKSGVVVQRFTCIEPGQPWSVRDRTSTDADGRFYFAEKFKKVRPTLIERHAFIYLDVKDHPIKGQSDTFFQLGRSDKRLNTASYILTSDMHCELTSESVESFLYDLDEPNALWWAFNSKCTFRHADMVLVKENELNGSDLEKNWASINHLVSFYEYAKERADSSEFWQLRRHNYATVGINLIHRIKKMETAPDKLHSLCKLEHQLQSYLTQLNKQDPS